MALPGSGRLLLVAYAAGVLMFFAPCSVGLLPAYVTYYLDRGDGSLGERSSSLLLAGGAALLLAGAVPLFYAAVAGLRVVLPGHDLVLSLATGDSGRYVRPVFVSTAGVLLLTVGVGPRALARAGYVGLATTAGVVATYLAVGLPVVALGQWVRDGLLHLELLAGPTLVVLGALYLADVSPGAVVSLPERGDRTTANYVAFGALYGVGSLACNLPVFLGLVLSSFATAGPLAGLAVFAAFGAGMGTLMVGVTLLVAATGGRVSLGRVARPLRYAGSVAFVVLGVYVTWFSLRSFGYL